jgi:hypothetical protein
VCRHGAALFRSVFAAAALAFLAAGCAAPVVSPPAPTETPAAPGSGTLHLTTVPDYDPHDPLELRYVDPTGMVLSEADSFDAETTVFLDRTLPAGPVRVIANGKACAGIIPIEANTEVDAVLSVPDSGCAISVSGSHAPGAIVHPEPRTALGAFVVLGSVLLVKPLDPGNAIEPIRKPADERAEVVDFAVPPGRYELSVLVDGAVLTMMEVDLKRGQAFYYNLRVLAANVPRVCGAVPRAQCEAAVTEAYARGLFPPPSSANLASVLVRPSTSSGCYDPPVFDVLFDVRGEPQPVEVTVATTRTGKLAVCTY